MILFMGYLHQNQSCVDNRGNDKLYKLIINIKIDYKFMNNKEYETKEIENQP